MPVSGAPAIALLVVSSSIFGHSTPMSGIRSSGAEGSGIGGPGGSGAGGGAGGGAASGAGTGGRAREAGGGGGGGGRERAGERRRGAAPPEAAPQRLGTSAGIYPRRPLRASDYSLDQDRFR